MDVPVLDDRTYDDLVAEGLAQVTRLLPAWTDLNPSDPGRTLVELFAYVVESLFYQLDVVPERVQQDFAVLLGTAALPGEAPDATLRRAIAALRLPSRAVTAEDISFLVTNGVALTGAPLAGGHAAGAPAAAWDRLPAFASLTAPAAPGAREVSVALTRPGTTLLDGDRLLLVDDPRTEVVTVSSWTGSPVPGSPVAVTLAAPLRFGHDAPASVDRLTGPAAVAPATLAAAVGAGDAVLRLNPAGRMPRDPVLLVSGTGGDDDEWVAARPVGRAESRVTDLPADGYTDRRLDVLVLPGAGPVDPGLLATLHAATFAQLRDAGVLTTWVRVAAPGTQVLDVDVSVVRARESLLAIDAVATAATTALVAAFDPLTGGAGTGRPLGLPAYRSQLYGLLERVPGVDHVAALLMSGDPDTDVWPAVLGVTDLVVLGEVRVRVVDA